MHDIQGNVLGLRIGAGFSRSREQRNLLAAPDLLALLPCRGIDQDVAVAQPGREAAARMLREHLRQRLIQPQSGELRGNRQLPRLVPQIVRGDRGRGIIMIRIGGSHHET